MKTQPEIEKKLQDLEALILNLREDVKRVEYLAEIPKIHTDLIITEHQANVLKWVLQ
jgi:hypothetical protein